METRKITIGDNGRISVPDYVQMQPFEIAALLGVYVQTVNARIKTVLKSGVVKTDYPCPMSVSGNTVTPDFYGLEMITALAFRISSPKADVFREWVIRLITTGYNPLPATLLLQLSGNVSLN